MSEKSTITEKNVPTNPSLWKKFVDQAKRKFDVYPSAYANGWASKQYKDAGGKWKTEGVEEPQHVAAGLPQTKELKGKKIGERFLEYLQDNGLKHAAYQNENGDVKVIGLNKDQVKEAIKNCVDEYKLKEIGLPGGAGVGVSLPGGYINGAPKSDDVKKMRAKLKEADEEGEGESKKFPGHYHLGGGYYATTKGGEAVKKTDKGQLRNLTPKEKAEKAAEKTGGKAQPAAQQPATAAKPATQGAAAARAGAKPEAPKPTQPAAKPEAPTSAKPQAPTTPTPAKPDTSKMSPEDKKATEEYEREKEGLDHHEKAAYEFLDGISPDKRAEAINQALENRSFWQKFSQDTTVGSWMKKKGKQFADTGAGLKSLFSGRKPRRFGVVQDCSEAPKESVETLKEGPKDRQDYLASLGKGGAPKPEEPKKDKDTSGCKPVHYEDFMEKDEQGNPVYEEKEEPVYKQGKKPDVSWAVSYGGKFNNNDIDPKTGFYFKDGKYYGFDEKEVDKDGNLLGKDGKPKPATNLFGKPKTRKIKVPKFKDNLTPEQLDLAHESHHASHEQRHAVIHTATEVGMVVAGVATGGLLAGAGKTAFGITTGTTTAAEHGIMHTVMHVATHTVKDIGKHAALEVLGAPDAYTAGSIGAGLTFATGGVLENNSLHRQLFLISEDNGGDVQKNSQFYQDLLKKTMEKMKTFEMTPQQKLQSIRDYKKKKAEGGFEKKETTPMNESVNKDRVKEIANFVEFASKRLKLNERPKVKLVKEADYIAKAIGEDGASALGSFVPSENKIMVVNDGRLVADVLRTIAHEMVHRKQQELGKLEDIGAAGKTGSKIENEANSIAGILLREYGKRNKSIYERRLNEAVYNKIEKEVADLYTETQSLKEYIQKQIK